MTDTTLRQQPSKVLAFIGFGEAGRAFASGLHGVRGDLSLRAFDIKSLDLSTGPAMAEAYRSHRVSGMANGCEAVFGAEAVFSLVTADRALAVAESLAEQGLQGQLYLDCNSCSPGTKRQSCALIEAAGGRYVDVAVMAPVHPGLHQTPLLVSGPHAREALDLFDALDMRAKLMPGEVGRASSVKMVRSIMIKGLEALTLECVLAGRQAGVEEEVLATLDKSFPGFDWPNKAAYMMERVMTHGIRRAAEMREVAKSVEEWELAPHMARATVERQQEVGDLKMDASLFAPDYQAYADALLLRLQADQASTPGRHDERRNK